MRKINKLIFGLFLLGCLASVMSTITYLDLGIVRTKWGDFVGEPALHTLIAYWILTFSFGFYSIDRGPKENDKNDTTKRF